MTAILFVCAGNTCRSPTGAAVLRNLLDRSELGDSVQVDSAGTRVDRPGAPPEPLARQVALRHGIDLGGHRARPVRAGDFDAVGYMLAMDRAIFADLKSRRPDGTGARVDLLLSFAPDIDHDEVLDPYGRMIADYEHAYQLIATGVAGFLAVLQTRIG